MARRHRGQHKTSDTDPRRCNSIVLTNPRSSPATRFLRIHDRGTLIPNVTLTLPIKAVPIIQDHSLHLIRETLCIIILPTRIRHRHRTRNPILTRISTSNRDLTGRQRPTRTRLQVGPIFRALSEYAQPKSWSANSEV